MGVPRAKGVGAKAALAGMDLVHDRLAMRKSAEFV